MRILGVHAGHDAAAALLVDGEVVADAAEERFQRVKHASGVPFHAIDFCLREGSCPATELDVVAVVDGLDEAVPVFDPLVAPSAHPPFDLLRFPVGQQTEVVHVAHHAAHAASAFFTSGFEGRTLVVTCDGVGEDVSVTLWRGEGGSLTPLQSFDASASLGWFFEVVTEALGWWSWDGAGRTMGLAAYGDPGRAAGVLDPWCPRFEDGELVRPVAPGVRSAARYQGQEHVHFEAAHAIRLLVGRHGREHVAAEAQRLLEEQVGALVLPWLEREGTDQLAAAGGVFLNVKLNQSLWETGRLRAQHAFPNAADSGLALGAALYALHELEPSAPNRRLASMRLGPSFEPGALRERLDLCGVGYREVDDPAEAAAARLADGAILGWFQGRMESGPRALGGRSILMSPVAPDAKEILNARVKFREAFRPFCPSMLAEARERYMPHSRSEPFMVTSFDVAPEQRNRIPAVVHVDGTARPQTVEREIDPLYADLIEQLGRATGEPVVLNTSFNVRGEPIVCEPTEAIRCFFSGGMDHLLLGPFLVSKPGARG